MRYYKIAITPKTGATITYTSLTASGGFNPGALNIVFDILAAAYGTTETGQSYVEIQGVSLQTVMQADALTNAKIQVYGGMSKGLPLANPAQQGLLVEGYIGLAFGNWVGPEMSLVLYIYPVVSSTPGKPTNLVLNWKAGTSLADAITTTFAGAYPTSKVTFNLTSDLILAHDEVGFYPDINTFAEVIHGLSIASNKTPGYLGVRIKPSGGDVHVYDTPTSKTPTRLAFSDLMGQPTWVATGTIQVVTVLRGDLDIGSTFVMPKGSNVYGVITPADAGIPSVPSRTNSSGNSNGVAFSGVYSALHIRYVGEFRSPDGANWVTVIDAYPAPAITSVQETSG